MRARSRRPDDETDEASAVGLRRFLSVFGVFAVAAGFVVLIAPGVGSGLSMEYLVVMAIGAALLFFAARRWFKRALSSVDTAETPPVERRTTVSVPGDDFDEMLIKNAENAMGRLQVKSTSKDRIRAVAEAVFEGDGADVDEQLQAGTWSDDADAVALFSGQRTSVRDRVSSFVSGTPVLQRRIVSAIEQLAGLAGEEVSWGEIPDRSEDREPTEPGDHATDRWHGLTALALTTVGFGVLLSQPGLVLCGAVLSGLGAYAVAGSSPSTEVRIDRDIQPTDPHPGDSVSVTVEVENVGEQLIPDLRIVDGVPADLTVEDNSPRHGTALRPGATMEYTYTLSGVRGNHTFEDAFLVSRNLPGTLERVAETDVDGDQSVTYDVASALDLSVPLRKHASMHVGRVLTDSAGSGLEFHSVREYRSGDPLTRIDWSRAARGEGLATLQFHEERAATVVLVIDARREAYVASDDDSPSAVDRSVLAAAKLASALLAADDRVGLAALSPRQCWLSPGAGHTHLARLHDILATDEAFAPSPPTLPYYQRINLPALRKRLPSDSQLLVFSPLVDDEVVGVVRQLQASGHPVTIISPDSSGSGTPGRTLARLERRKRLSELRGANVRVVDWDRDESLALALTNAGRRWS
ncbi:DUF58 domain-containing protein [Halorhabdus sp. BNX81]|uniref:DUF58 domain-containing protein n=1 Tax=Halorhabdus sp. BNX81 TaxID=2980181 RepID=UPI0023DD4D96|nr:DUF58 domain-containing protein [Halorhabdus sp. BNX81]WEL22182.1 putative membrane anchored protein with extracellular vWF domain and Ig-like domain [Halorhabdus sp. BNX81]